MGWDGEAACEEQGAHLTLQEMVSEIDEQRPAMAKGAPLCNTLPPQEISSV